MDTLIAFLSLWVIGCAAWMVRSFATENKNKLESQEIPQLPVVVEREPKPTTRPMTKAEAAGFQMESEVELVDAMTRKQQELAKKYPEIMARPVGDKGDTVASMLNRRLYAVISKIMEGRDDE